MKKLLLWGIPAFILMAFVGWRFVGRNASQASQQSGKGRAAAVVSTSPTTSYVMVRSIQSVGNVEAPYKIEISPKSAGRIEYLEAREGDTVKPGDVLLRIDPGDLKGAVLEQRAGVAQARSRLAQAKLSQGSTNVGITSQIQQQRAAVNSAVANYSQLKQNYDAQVATAEAQIGAANSAIVNAQAVLTKENASLRNAQTQYERILGLAKKGYTAEQNADNAKTAVEVQQAAVGVAQAQVQSAKLQLQVQQQNLLIVKRKGTSDIAAGQATVTQARANLNMAQANRSQGPAYQENLQALQDQVDASIALLKQAESRLSDTVVKSSISGTVTARKADPGALASPGTPVLEVQFIDWLYVSATIPVDQSTQVGPGQMGSVTIDGLPGRTFSGPIVNVNPAADPLSRKFSVKIRLENKDHSIKPGMYARLSIVTGQVKADVVVPHEAVKTSSDGSTTVAVVDADKVAHVRPVKIGLSDDRGVQILEGVTAGENVVVLSFNPVKDGQKVSIAKPEDASDAKKAKGKKKGD